MSTFDKRIVFFCDVSREHSVFQRYVNWPFCSQTGKLLNSVREHSKQINDIQTTSDYSMVITASKDTSAKVGITDKIEGLKLQWLWWLCAKYFKAVFKSQIQSKFSVGDCFSVCYVILVSIAKTISRIWLKYCIRRSLLFKHYFSYFCALKNVWN